MISSNLNPRERGSPSKLEWVDAETGPSCHYTLRHQTIPYLLGCRGWEALISRSTWYYKVVAVLGNELQGPVEIATWPEQTTFLEHTHGRLERSDGHAFDVADLSRRSKVAGVVTGATTVDQQYPTLAKRATAVLSCHAQPARLCVSRTVQWLHHAH